MKEVVGDVEVPLYDSAKADPAAPINASSATMKFSDYIDLIKKEPTDLRIFLFDPIKYAPKLLEDYISPKELMAKHPTLVVEKAVRGMLPKTKLGKKLYTNLFVYAGDTHPHSAQAPKTIKL